MKEPTVSARVELDSLNPFSYRSFAKEQRITTFILEYPRIIHSELLTHRCFSRNCASSRAIPAIKQIQQVEESPAFPAQWGTNNAGMQSKSLHTDPELCYTVWFKAANEAALNARRLNRENLHKQIVNRPLEPFVKMKTVLTVNNHYGILNFFWQRAHKDADPTLQLLAYSMLKCYLASEPQLRFYHIPMVDIDNLMANGFIESKEDAIHYCKISAGKCAAVSYKRDDDERSDDDWVKLFEEKLVNQPKDSPLHLSPLEHQAFACPESEYISSNLRGWNQFRIQYQPKNIEINLEEVLNSAPDWIKSLI